MSLSQLTLAELQGEIQRRVTKLRDERELLLRRLEEIDAQLAQFELQAASDPNEGGIGRRSATTRRANARPLRVILIDVFRDAGRPLTTREAADASLAKGYTSTSRNFTNTVYVTLHKDEQFARSDDGTWVLHTST